jgi:hypothetical protein
VFSRGDSSFLKVSRCGGKCNGVDWSGEAGSKALSMELQELMSFGALARRDLQKMQVQLSEMRVQMQSYVSRPQLRLFRGVRLETQLPRHPLAPRRL